MYRCIINKQTFNDLKNTIFGRIFYEICGLNAMLDFAEDMIKKVTDLVIHFIQVYSSICYTIIMSKFI